MPHSGKPSEYDEECLKALLKENGHQTSHELADESSSFNGICQKIGSLGASQA